MYEMLTGALPFTGKDRRETMERIMKAKLQMPTFLSAEAQSLLRALFKRNPKNRLGSGADGEEKLKSHIFFSGIDYNALLRKELTPPFVPTFRDHRAADDATYFDREFTKRPPRDSPAVAASAGAQDVFRGFSYSAQSTNAMKTPKTPGEDEKMETDFRSDAPEGYFLTSGDRKSFETQYELLDTIGVGSFSEVKRCRHRQTGKLFAVKISQRNGDGNHQGMRDDEIQVLIRYGQHPNIITLKGN